MLKPTALRFLAASGPLAIAAFSICGVAPPRTLRIVLVGDIMLSRGVAARMAQARDPLLPFTGISALLDSSDCNFGNLESPFATPDRPDGVAGGRSLFFAAPYSAVRGLKRYRFHILSLANNHAFDQDEEGLEATLRHLSDSGIKAVGAGRNLDEAWRAEVFEAEGTRVGFLAASYASINDGGKEVNEQVARIEDTARLKAGIRKLKQRADVVIVSMHAGTEYTAEPDPAQVAFAHAAIDAGADVVLGSHPHWVQPAERYGRGLIFYSLGNFVFDLEGVAEQGLAVKLVIDSRGLALAELCPVRIEMRCCPRPANPAESREILKRMRAASTLFRLR